MAFFSKARGILQHKITNHIGREISASTPFIFEAIRCMSSKLFVGGLSYQTDEGTLQQAFEKYGQVSEARIIIDRDSGNSRGFGFVTFDNAEAASSAIMALDGQDLQGRKIRVNHAHDRGQGYGGGGGYNNYGGNNGGGGGYNNYGGNNGGGGGYNNYGNGGNYGSNYGGGGEHGTNVGNYSDGNYRPSSGGDYGSAGSTYPNSGGNHDTGNNLTNGNVYQGENFNYPSENNQNFGVAAGGGGNDNYIADGGNGGSNFTSSGYENNSGLSYGGGDQSGNNVNSGVSYDNEPDDFQERRAS